MKLDPVIDEDTGRAIVRTGTVMAFFCKGPVEALGDPIWRALERYVAAIPSGVLKYVIPSATADGWSTFTTKTIASCKDKLKPANLAKRRMTAFRLNDASNGAPTYAFDMIGRSTDKPSPNEMTLVQMTFPLDAIAARSVERFVSLARDMAEILPFTSGYASPGFPFAHNSGSEAFDALRPVAMRHPGYDVEFNSTTRTDIGQRSRGARWLTFLGSSLVKKLGGTAKLAAALDAPATLGDLSHGVLLRASVKPELGDTKKRVPTPGLRAIARAIEPVTWFREGVLCSYLADFDWDVLREWERRFLD